jgi:hypothetical protein
MKKTIIIAAALLLSADMLSSQVKVAKTQDNQLNNLQKVTVSTDRKDVATAD